MSRWVFIFAGFVYLIIGFLNCFNGDGGLGGTQITVSGLCFFCHNVANKLDL
jgi:hypothetical protein